ncbi:4-hydroxythreonine-4-phosphate dehydrogenase PdxA [Shinella sp.]|uniref:4-hydroxythreonine-4-phosphate dehydrogenase PdxA n=1 Tax=Shinella sp. TaxID=1870904 RepID=UPI0028B09A87|nr:4-hydroxythreonine-4-phosphate dehydrogenase PdxA [Shinella sp.]
MTTLLKPLALTMGDPAGIGPEIIARTMLEKPELRANLVIGDPGAMSRAIAMLGGALDLNVVEHSEAPLQEGAVNVLTSSTLTKLPPMGTVSAEAGRMAYDAIIAAIRLAKAGKVAGIVTAPIHKEALSAAGISYPGHTEILAEHGGGGRVAMMLANDDIRTVLVTIHCSLAEAIRRADFPAQMAAIRLAHQGGRALGIERPRIAVAGLNPHAGEGGLFGDEEIRIIRPAIAAARAEGIDASGPWPGDTVFMQARNGRFDIVVAQYHDQGLIPVKYLGLERGVNITLGLPFVRTSPDHGTAFDIAGRSIADPASLQTAIDYARRLAGTSSDQE